MVVAIAARTEPVPISARPEVFEFRTLPPRGVRLNPLAGWTRGGHGAADNVVYAINAHVAFTPPRLLPAGVAGMLPGAPLPGC